MNIEITRHPNGKRSMNITDYELYDLSNDDFFTKQHILNFIKTEQERIKLAQAQLKDIEKMSEEL